MSEHEYKLHKNRKKYNDDVEFKKRKQYQNRKSTAKIFLLKEIKEEDKEIFKEIIKNF